MLKDLLLLCCKSAKTCFLLCYPQNQAEHFFFFLINKVRQNVFSFSLPNKVRQNMLSLFLSTKSGRTCFPSLPLANKVSPRNLFSFFLSTKSGRTCFPSLSPTKLGRTCFLFPHQLSQAERVFLLSPQQS